MTTITFYNYRKGFGWLGFLAMGWLRIPLVLNREVKFWKLLGVGQAGFRPEADGARWAILLVWKNEPLINLWWQKLMGLKAKTKIFYLKPTFGHGKWDGGDPFIESATSATSNHKIAVLTRASIKWTKAKLFWANVPAVALDLTDSFKPEFTAGIGEVPYIRQATFSVWKDEEEMKKFAYGNQAHRKVIEMTKVHHWYHEELFYRFQVIDEK